MPLRIRNWADPFQRLLYALDRDLDKLVKTLPKTPTFVKDKVIITEQCPAQAIPPMFQEVARLNKELKVVKDKKEKELCCGTPNIIYKSDGHDWVCSNCGRCTHANFEEVGGVVQYEQRGQSAPLGSVYCPYDRNKHFKKVLRDVTKMPIRVPDKLIMEMREKIKKPINVSKVRAFLRGKKLYHYYSSANYMSHLLGDKSHRITMDSRAYSIMCREADAFSDSFDRMRRDGLTTRKNFVNAHVLILRIATVKFNLPEIKKHLRLPRKETLLKHQQLLDKVDAFRWGN